MQGYFINAFTPNDHEDNIKSAYALACTIKQHDPDREICVMVDDYKSMPTKYKSVFDYMVELPYGVTDSTLADANAELWQMYYCTPFDETMYINCNSVVLSSIDSMWDNMSLYDFFVPTHTINFRHELNIKDEIFRNHRLNEIDTMYTDIMFFKKSVVASEIFKMLDVVSKNWRDIYNAMLSDRIPTQFDINILINVVITMTGTPINTISNDDVTYTYNDLRALHLTDNYPKSWVNAIMIWYKNGNTLTVGNFAQSGVFVYGDQQFITDERLNDITNYYQNNKATPPS